MALIFLGAFIWALKTGQNDDVYTPAVRMLFDDEIKDKIDEPNPEIPVKSKKWR